MVNISKLKLTRLQERILRLFFIKSGNSLNAHEIAKALEVSQPAVSKAIPKLESDGLLLVKKDKNSGRYSIELNRDNQKSIWLKRADNLKQIYESGLAQLLFDTFPGATIVLFGSYAFGEDTKDSDIDLAVIGVHEKGLDLIRYNKILERPIILNYYQNFKSIDKHLLNNILNGIILKGAVEL